MYNFIYFDVSNDRIFQGLCRFFLDQPPRLDFYTRNFSSHIHYEFRLLMDVNE